MLTTNTPYISPVIPSSQASLNVVDTQSGSLSPRIVNFPQSNNIVAPVIKMGTPVPSNTINSYPLMNVGTIVAPTVNTPDANLNLVDVDLLARNRDLANILGLISAYYSMSGDKYRARAFGKASAQIGQYPIDIISGSQARREISGIGESIQTAIDEYLATGTIQRLNELENKFTDRKNVIDLFRSIHGIGSVTAVKFYDQGYRTLEDLWFKAKLTDAQKIGILWKQHFDLRIPYDEMVLINNSIGAIFNPYHIKWAVAGSFRRHEDTSGDVDLFIESRPDINMDVIINLLKPLLPENTKLAQGDKLYMGVIRLSDQYNGHRLDIRIVDPNSYIYMLMHFTGSQQFNILMRQRAIQFDLTLNEYGLFDINKNSIPANSEEDIFRALRVQYIPPKDRTKTLSSLNYI